MVTSTASDRWFDGTQWRVIGQAAPTVVPPSVPTNLTVAPLSTQITVTCTVPVSDGGGAITGYFWTITPTAGGTTLTASTGAAVLTKTWTGLLSSTAYTETVAAINSAGTGPAATTNAVTSTASTSTVKYGPDGSVYPSNTPAVNATVFATIALNDIAGLKTALRTVPSGQVILLANGTWTSATVNDATAKAHLLGLAQNVLIRPVTWGGATIGMTVQVPHTTWMGFTLNGFGFSGYPNTSADAARSRVAQCKTIGPLTMQSCIDLEIVEVVELARGLDYDTLQINTENIASSTNARVSSDYKILRSWFAGSDVSSGSALHIDDAQLLVQAGNNLIDSTFFGPGGNSSSLSVSADEQYSWTPGVTTVQNNYVCATPGANGFEMKGTNLITVVATGNELESAVINVGTSTNKTLYDLTHITFTGNKMPGGLGGNYNPPGPFQSSFPSNTYGAVLTRPTFVNPPWWW